MQGIKSAFKRKWIELERSIWYVRARKHTWKGKDRARKRTS